MIAFHPNYYLSFRPGRSSYVVYGPQIPFCPCAWAQYWNPFSMLFTRPSLGLSSLSRVKSSDASALPSMHHYCLCSGNEPDRIPYRQGCRHISPMMR